MAKTPAPTPAPTPTLIDATPTAAPTPTDGRPATDAPPSNDTEPKQPSVFRRHPLATGIAAGVIAVVLVSGLTAWGVGAAVTASLTSSNASAPMAMPTTAPTAGGAAGAAIGGTGATATGRLAFRATIQSMDGDSWSILTKQGKSVTVMVDASTRFGTRAATATVADFAIGDSVIVVAMRGTDAMPTATRIVKSPAES